MAEQPEVDPSRRYLVGYSQGGQIALLAAARGAPVRALVTFAPVVDPESWYAETDVQGVQQYLMEECGGPAGWPERSVLKHVGEINQPLLLVHGDADRRVPTRQSRELYKRLQALRKPAELKLLPDIGKRL